MPTADVDRHAAFSRRSGHQRTKHRNHLANQIAVHLCCASRDQAGIRQFRLPIEITMSSRRCASCGRTHDHQTADGGCCRARDSIAQRFRLLTRAFRTSAPARSSSSNFATCDNGQEARDSGQEDNGERARGHWFSPEILGRSVRGSRCRLSDPARRRLRSGTAREPTWWPIRLIPFPYQYDLAM
jgi:hypothetical protein